MARPRKKINNSRKSRKLFKARQVTPAKTVWNPTSTLSKPIPVPITVDFSKKGFFERASNLGRKQFNQEAKVYSKAFKSGKAAGGFMNKMFGGGVKGIGGIGNMLGKGSKLMRSIPAPIRGAGIAGGLVAGATAMLGISMMKGAMNQSREIVYERYMQDQAISKNMLNNTRLGLAAGTSRMNNMGHTMGLSNSLSRTRHG